MIVVETKAKNFSLQFTTKIEATQYLEALGHMQDAGIQGLAPKLIHRLGDQYAHDDIHWTTVVYNTEASIFLNALLELEYQIFNQPSAPIDKTKASTDDKPFSKLKKWFKD